MAAKGTDYDELNRRLEFQPDGLPVRKTGDWTRHKLALLAYYLPAFAGLCHEKAGGWYYLDGFAGNGANETPEFPLAKGSALIGISQEPRAHKALLIERDRSEAATLTQRAEPYGAAVRVLHGDANEIVPAEIGWFDERYLPGFCMLDPEGLELDWSTVVACSQQRSKGTPYELLIYFSTPGAARSAGVRDDRFIGANQVRLTRLFGNRTWQAVAEQQAARALAPGEAGRLYLELYKAQLADLGYSDVMQRAAVRSDGNLLYHLVFATANAAGAKIMSDALERAYAGQMPLQF